MALASIGAGGITNNPFYQSVSGNAQSSVLSTPWQTSLRPTADASPDEGQADAAAPQSNHGDTFSKIEAVVNGALGAAQSDTSGDPAAIVDNAIAQAFPPGPANPDGAAPAASLDQALDSYGVDPQRFQDNLRTAVEHAQQGQPDPNAVFGLFPIGSSLNTVA